MFGFLKRKIKLKAELPVLMSTPGLQQLQLHDVMEKAGKMAFYLKIISTGNDLIYIFQEINSFTDW